MSDLSRKPEPNPVFRKQHCHRGLRLCGTHRCDAKIITRDDNAERVACDFEGRKADNKDRNGDLHREGGWISNLNRY